MCTAIYLKEGLLGRTLDYERSFGEGVVFTPRERMPLGKAKNRYAMLGIGVIKGEYSLYFDGLNEWGLSGAALNFPGYAVYKSAPESKEGVPSALLMSYALGLCRDVGEVREMLANISICSSSAIGIQDSSLHWIFADKSGAITIEATERGLEVWDNPYGVMTNSPDLSYHKTRLADYMHLHSGYPENYLELTNLECYSRGMAAVGLPGDFSSSSRFVRAAFIRQNTISFDGANSAVLKMKSILSALSVPLGCVSSREGEAVSTRYLSVMDSENLVYYFSSYQSFGLRGVRLCPEDRELKTYPVYQDDKVKMLN